MSGHVGRHTSVLLDGYALLREFQGERRRAQEANQGAKTCTAPRPRKHYDDRFQGWYGQAKSVSDSIDPTGLLWCGFDHTFIPTRYADPKNDVVPLGDYCHRLPVLLESLNNLLDKRSKGGTGAAGGTHVKKKGPGRQPLSPARQAEAMKFREDLLSSNLTCREYCRGKGIDPKKGRRMQDYAQQRQKKLQDTTKGN